MRAMRMTHLTTATGEFHARVLAARLGSDGICTELRGPMGGPYPLGGPVQVLVSEDDLEPARELLAADATEAVLAGQVEAALAGLGVDAGGADDPAAAGPLLPARLAAWRAWTAVAVVLVLVLLALARSLS
ncbi:MAG TPA: hypothetical protein VFH45_07945 [Acidimicrobiales bacterium]|nr:hypothetical protein [Acidimicrobiales bacterium]